MAEETKKEETPKEELKGAEKKPASAESASVAEDTSAKGAATASKEGKKSKEEKIEIPEKFKKLVDEIEKMKVADLAELVKILEKKFGVSAAPVAVAAPGGAPAFAEAAEGKEEKSSYNIELKSVGEKKIEVIKAVRDVTEKGLKEAKDLVDAAASGSQVVKENVKKEEAEEIKKKFEAVGAKIELK